MLVYWRDGTPRDTRRVVVGSAGDRATPSLSSPMFQLVANPTWMDPRAVYLDVAGNWGSVRAGRDFGLFSRGNLFMNYELGHAYGLGFPCAYATIFAGSESAAPFTDAPKSGTLIGAWMNPGPPRPR